MAKEEKSHLPKSDASAPKTAKAAEEKSPAANQSKPASGLSLQQKGALIGAAVIIALVLGILLFPAPSESADQQTFSHYLYNNSRNGILVDARGAGANLGQAIMQCGVNYISSPFYTNGSDKDLLAYFCDNSGCLSSEYNFALPNSSAIVSNKSVPFSEAVIAMHDRAYIHIHAGAQDKDFIYHPTYMEVIIGAKSNPDYCQLRAVGG